MIEIDTTQILQKTGVTGVTARDNTENYIKDNSLHDVNLSRMAKNAGVTGVTLELSATYDDLGESGLESKSAQNSQVIEKAGVTPVTHGENGMRDSFAGNKSHENEQVAAFVTPVTPVTHEKQWGRKCTSAFTNFSDPETPGHHWLCPERGWIQSAVEKKPRGYIGQTLTNPTDPEELAELLAQERAQAKAGSASCDREPANRVLSVDAPLTDPLEALADLPLLGDDRRFIQQQLYRIPKQQHSDVLAEYRQHWLKAAAQAPDENRRDNQGRRAANLFLLRRNT